MGVRGAERGGQEKQGKFSCGQLIWSEGSKSRGDRLGERRVLAASMGMGTRSKDGVAAVVGWGWAAGDVASHFKTVQ